MAFLTIDDLTPFADIDSDKADAMIEDAVAQAALHAPCLAAEEELTTLQLSQVKSVLRSVVLRWNEAGSGALAAETIGPFGIQLDTRQARRALLSPSEIIDLQKICQGISTRGRAFSVDLAADVPVFQDCVWCGGFGTCGVC